MEKGEWIQFDDETWGLMDRIADEWTSALPIDTVYQMVKRWHFHQVVNMKQNEPEIFNALCKAHGDLTVDNYDEVPSLPHPYTSSLIEEMDRIMGVKTWQEEEEQPPFDADFFKGLGLN